MRDKVYKYLKFIRFKDVVQWDLKRYLNNSVKSKYEVVALNKLINEESKKFDISDKKSHYGILGVNNQTGVFDAYIESGAKIKQKYKKMDTGWIAYNPYRVNVGSIGIKRSEHKYDYISPAYVVFSCKPSILPEYLYMTMKTPSFNKIIRDNTTGSVRQNLSFDVLKGLTVPLPSIEEQQSIVNAYNDRLSKAKRLEQNVKEVENSIEDYMLSELGIQPQGYPITESELPKASEPQVEYVVNGKQNTDLTDTYIWGNEIKQAYKYLRFVRFKDVGRWDCYNDISLEESSIYKNIKLSDVVASKPQYGASFSSKDYDGLIRYIRITDINEDGSLSDDKVSADGYSERYLLKENDFLIARSGNTVGKTFLYKENVGKAIYAGYLIKFELNTNIIIPEYLLYYTKCFAYKHWVQSNMRVAAQPNINCQQYLDSPIILPPLEIQSSIIAHINKQKSQIKELKKQAETLRKEALDEFEKEIFEQL